MQFKVIMAKNVMSSHNPFLSLFLKSKFRQLSTTNGKRTSINYGVHYCSSCGTFFIHSGDYCHGTDVVGMTLRRRKVNVTKIDEGYFLTALEDEAIIFYPGAK